jgi:hypothetical protein
LYGFRVSQDILACFLFVMTVLYFVMCGRTKMFGPACVKLDSDGYLELEGNDLKRIYSSSESHKSKINRLF